MIKYNVNIDKVIIKKEDKKLQFRECAFCNGMGVVAPLNLFPRPDTCRICKGTGKIKVDKYMIETKKDLIANLSAMRDEFIEKKKELRVDLKNKNLK